jgi:hypothetical protein
VRIRFARPHDRDPSSWVRQREGYDGPSLSLTHRFDPQRNRKCDRDGHHRPYRGEGGPNIRRQRCLDVHGRSFNQLPYMFGGCPGERA